MLDALRKGRESCRRRAWNDAYRALTLADRASPLEVDDVERLAISAYLTGREAEFHRLLGQAHRALVAAGDRCRAARCAFWLGITLLLRGEPAQASAWLGRARRLIDGRDCAEQGYLLLPVAEEDLTRGELDAARTEAAAAAEIGDRFSEPDLIACARHLEGRALIRKGQVHDGLALLDEAMLSVIAGELSPIMTGLVYCSVIEACQQVFASSRAREWTSALARWCEQQPDMVAFTDTCLVRRAEILRLHGAWSDAMAEACRACEPRSSKARSSSSAAAFYQQAEIHRLRGDFAAAEDAYRNAARLGWEPQPGLALLRMAQKRIDAACAAIRRAVCAATDPLERARLLPAEVEILLAAGESREAHAAGSELEGIALRFDTDVLKAAAAHARGALEALAGEPRLALAPLRRAFELWQQIETPYEAARARALIGVACRSLGDQDAAGAELAAAQAVFERLGAAPELARLDSFVLDSPPPARHPLTSRELEVLRRIAAGKTNKTIAGELRLSERTVDRHVSNILTKLDVPARAAATAYAYEHKLLSDI